jgi:hypothetical protein
MVWAFLLLIGVIVGVQWWEYSRAVQEYSFAQPAGMDVGAVLTEKTPLVVEIGPLPWRPAVATGATWTLEDGRRVSEWLGEPGPVNLTGVAEQADLVTGLADLDAGRPWWWLPGLHTPKVGVLEAGKVRGLNWVTAERRWIGCSHGAPLRVWLVHSRYRRYLPAEQWCDPWTLTVAEAPWIGRVQFVEVVVKPGWCIGIPAHWGFAVRPDGDDKEASWWWRADQHSLASAAVASKGVPSVGENESRVSAV